MCLGFPDIQQPRQSCYSGKAVPDNCQHSQILPQQNYQEQKKDMSGESQMYVGKKNTKKKSIPIDYNFIIDVTPAPQTAKSSPQDL